MFMGYSQKLKHSVGFEPIRLTPATTLYQLCCNTTYIKQNGFEPLPSCPGTIVLPIELPQL